jgi:hypothetical protein
MAWSPDARKALLQVDRQPGHGFRLWLVDLVKRKSTQMPLDGLPEPKVPDGKAVPFVDRVSFDPQGRPVALVIYALVGMEQLETGPDGKRFIPFEGQRYPVVEGAGDPALVIAYRFEGGSWKRIELKSASSLFADLETARTLQLVASIRWETGGKLVPVEGVPDTQGTGVSSQLQRNLLLDLHARERGAQDAGMKPGGERTAKHYDSLEKVVKAVLTPKRA